MQRTYGFTIVELLIVIVVIAILAALSYVGYTSISNRAHDSTVQSDLANFAKAVKLIHAETGEYPLGGSIAMTEGGATTGHVSYAPSHNLTLNVATSSYEQPTGTGSANFIYCTGVDPASGVAGFAVFARGASGKNFRYSSDKGLESEVRPGSSPSPNLCRDNMTSFPQSVSYGYFVNNGGWQSWTQ